MNIYYKFQDHEIVTEHLEYVLSEYLAPVYGVPSQTHRLNLGKKNRIWAQNSDDKSFFEEI